MPALSEIQFYEPEALALLLLLPLVWLLYSWQKGKTSLSLSSKRLISDSASRSLRLKFEFLPSLIKSLAFLLFVVALARPQTVEELTQTEGEGIDILMAMDTSLSMQALDMNYEGEEITRLDAVKAVVHQFISQRISDRIGLVLFGETAFTQCPMTLDYDTLKSFLLMIESGLAGQGTAIGNGLATAVKRLLDSKAKSKIIILLTDGRNESGEVSPMAAAELASKNNIKVYTIGVGSNQNIVPVLLKDDRGFLFKDRRALGGIDTETLQQIAQKTNGQFFRAQTLEVLAEVYETINQLEKSEVVIKKFSMQTEYYAYFLVLGLIFYILQEILKQTVFFRLP